MNLRKMLAVSCCLIAMAALGCKKDNLPKTVPAEGIVTLDGNPVEGATIVFIATQGNYNATAVSDASGKFKMNAFDTKTGAVPGSYKVQIDKTVMESATGKFGETDVNMKYGLPKKYSTFTTSGLSKDLGDQGDTAIKFELSSK
ncbi:MAG: carboxypeptidase-like regulatory domain-containing protein [Pirellulales bacterium]